VRAAAGAAESGGAGAAPQLVPTGVGALLLAMSVAVWYGSLRSQVATLYNWSIDGFLTFGLGFSFF
jgi:hypothetical protein